MMGHRLVASPWMARHAAERCLWCGRAGSLDGEPFGVGSSGRSFSLRVCGPSHRRSASRFLAFAVRFRPWIAAGIFLPLSVLLLGILAEALGHPFIPHEWNRLQFRTVVALTVVGTSLGYLAVKDPGGQPRCPFPLHNLFLLGIGNTLWVFRVVGAWWLALSAMAFLRRPPA